MRWLDVTLPALQCMEARSLSMNGKFVKSLLGLHGLTALRLEVHGEADLSYSFLPLALLTGLTTPCLSCKGMWEYSGLNRCLERLPALKHLRLGEAPVEDWPPVHSSLQSLEVGIAPFGLFSLPQRDLLPQLHSLQIDCWECPRLRYTCLPHSLLSPSTFTLAKLQKLSSLPHFTRSTVHFRLSALPSNLSTLQE